MYMTTVAQRYRQTDYRQTDRQTTLA